jgi:hypothetical protein
MGDISAAVLLKCFLGEPAERQRGDRAFEMRSGHAPGAMRAAPTREVVRFGPDHAFVTHVSTLLCVRLGFELGRGGTQQASSAKGELLPTDKYFPRIHRAAK